MSELRSDIVSDNQITDPVVETASNKARLHVSPWTLTKAGFAAGLAFFASEASPAIANDSNTAQIGGSTELTAGMPAGYPEASNPFERISPLGETFGGSSILKPTAAEIALHGSSTPDYSYLDYSATLPRSTSNRLPDKPGTLIHGVYITCGGGPDYHLDTGDYKVSDSLTLPSIADSFDYLQHWINPRTKDADHPYGMALRIDTAKDSAGKYEPDVTYIGLSTPCNSLVRPGYSNTNLVETALYLTQKVLPENHLNNPNTIYAVKLQTSVPEGCNYASHPPESDRAGAQDARAAILYARQDCYPYQDLLWMRGLIYAYGKPAFGANTYPGLNYPWSKKDLFYGENRPMGAAIFNNSPESIELDQAQNGNIYRHDIENGYGGKPSLLEDLPTITAPPKTTFEIDVYGHGEVRAAILGLGTKVCRSTVVVKKCVYPGIPANSTAKLTPRNIDPKYTFDHWGANVKDKRNPMSRKLAAAAPNLVKATFRRTTKK